MLSVRLAPSLEQQLNTYCASSGMSKSQVVQAAIGKWLVTAPRNKVPPPPETDLSFLAPDDPIRQWIGIIKDGPSTDEWMAITRGEDWNKP